MFLLRYSLGKSLKLLNEGQPFINTRAIIKNGALAPPQNVPKTTLLFYGLLILENSISNDVNLLLSIFEII